jgi:hypothetical protein
MIKLFERDLSFHNFIPYIVYKELSVSDRYCVYEYLGNELPNSLVAEIDSDILNNIMSLSDIELFNRPLYFTPKQIIRSKVHLDVGYIYAPYIPITIRDG